MKKIIIKKLHLLNFKGMRDFTIEFNDTITTVSGGNGLGKTTIFDAFTWLLFGKDSQDRKAFDIKTYDASGKTIERIPHEVSGLLVVNGEEISLCRRFNEKWTKKRGTSEEVFTGNEEERLYNDVPMSLKDWSEKINAICSEQVFKFITNPWYFSAQKTDVQRAMLFRMAGDVSDTEIAKGNKDFETLLAGITGKTMDEYKREIVAKKRRLKSEIEAIPQRIDERKRDVSALEFDILGRKIDFAELEKELEIKQKELVEVEAQISDIAKAYNAKQDARISKGRELAEVRRAMFDRETEIKNNVQRATKADFETQEELKEQVERLKAKKERLQNNIDAAFEALEACRKRRESLIAEWQEINAETLSFNEDDFVCPTCHRRFEIEEIEAKQTEIKERFNKNKVERIEDNNRRGKANKAQMDTYNEDIAKCNSEIDTITAKIAEYKENPLLTKEIVVPDANHIIEDDKEYKELVAKAQALQTNIDNDTDKPDTDALEEHKRKILADMDNIKSSMANKAQIERNNTRIAELEDELRNQSEELARLEGIEFTMQQFAKARVEAIEDKINGMFTIMKFKMFDTQINGGEVETCEAMADGIPYSTQNNAMRFNIGIDIINAICKSEGITAPIFADNSESVNDIIPTPSQLIRLVVTKDKELIVK